MIKNILLICLVCFSSVVFALPNDPDPAVMDGYVNIGTADPGVIDAANFAVQQMNRGTLVRINSAMSQVVTGINYSMQIEVLAPDQTTHIYNVVVFTPQAGEDPEPMQLISAEEYTPLE